VLVPRCQGDGGRHDTSRDCMPDSEQPCLVPRPADYPQRTAVFSRDGGGVRDVLPRERDKPAEFSSTWMRSDMAWTRPTFFLATSTAEAS
jgi:hypothetical protein